MPKAQPGEPELRVRFAASDEGIQRETHATEFAAFWRDQFGTVHFTAIPEEWWNEWFDRVEHDPSGIEYDRQGEEEEGEND